MKKAWGPREDTLFMLSYAVSKSTNAPKLDRHVDRARMLAKDILAHLDICGYEIAKRPKNNPANRMRLVMDSTEYVAYCDDEGLIGFGSGKPPHGHHPLISGNEEDMALVRELAHRDGNSFWVPGIRDGQGFERKLKAFRDAFYCDDGVTLYSKDMD